MCTFKVSKKPNVLNLKFIFNKIWCFAHILPPPRFISVYALGIYWFIHFEFTSFRTLFVDSTLGVFYNHYLSKHQAFLFEDVLKGNPVVLLSVILDLKDIKYMIKRFRKRPVVDRPPSSKMK